MPPPPRAVFRYTGIPGFFPVYRYSGLFSGIPIFRAVFRYTGIPGCFPVYRYSGLFSSIPLFRAVFRYTGVYLTVIRGNLNGMQVFSIQAKIILQQLWMDCQFFKKMFGFLIIIYYFRSMPTALYKPRMTKLGQGCPKLGQTTRNFPFCGVPNLLPLNWNSRLYEPKRNKYIEGYGIIIEKFLRICRLGQL